MDATAPESYAVESEDIEYRRYGDKALLARLYRPVGAHPPLPAIVEIHGGAWTSGDRLNNAAICAAIAAAGALALSLDFRMPPEAGYPASIADINFGIRWLKSRATEWGSRSELVGALATSSGGQQLMLTALKPRDPRYAALPLAGAAQIDARLAYVVLGWPVVDPLARYRMAQAKGIERFLAAHRAYFADEAAMSEGNPQMVLERGEPVALPPLLILQGTADDNLTPDMADRFAAAYAKRGGAVTLEKFPGEPHTFITQNPTSANSRRALQLAASFIRRQTR